MENPYALTPKPLHLSPRSRVTTLSGLGQACDGVTWPTPRPSLEAIFEIREFAGGRLGRRAGGEQLAVHPCEGFGCSVVRAQPQDQAAPRCDESPGSVDQFLNHRLQAPSLGRMTNRPVVAQQPALPDQAKDVHGQTRELANQTTASWLCAFAMALLCWSWQRENSLSSWRVNKTCCQH